MDELERIAASLTAGQRDYLAGKLPNLRPASESAVIHALKKHGLYEVRYEITPLGLQVRAILSEGTDNG